MTDKAHILSEIRRTAAENGGRPLGRRAFETHTGIRETDWSGRHWLRCSDAIVEAGLEPNEKSKAYSDEFMLMSLAHLVRELGDFPVTAEFKRKSLRDRAFPNVKTWARIGSMSELPRLLVEFCATNPDFRDVHDICANLTRNEAVDECSLAAKPLQADQVATLGYVYLLKFRSDYKIGASNDPDRRYGEVATQMPEAMMKVHPIKTDEPVGVEKYWHLRFDAKPLKDEWFRLSQTDVRAFKRCKTIF